MTFRSPNSWSLPHDIPADNSPRPVESDALEAMVTAGEDSGSTAHTVIRTRPVKAGPSLSQC